MKTIAKITIFSSALCFYAFAFIGCQTSQAQWVPDSTAYYIKPPTNHLELFNGKDFTGWIFVSSNSNAPAEAGWPITNGVIHCPGKPNGYLRTQISYHDYQLHAEWRFPEGAGDGGVFLHINPPGQVWPMCFEVLLQSGSAGEVRLLGGSSADGLTPANSQDVPHRQPSSEKPIGEWNDCDIICRSNTITVRVNGVLQNDITGTSISSGMIGLQAGGTAVEFQNIYLEPLPTP